jgi:lysophospholipase L1-like esterase
VSVAGDDQSSTPASARLAWAVIGVGALAVVAIVGAGWIAGDDGIGPLQRAALLGAAAVIGCGVLLRTPAVARSLESYAAPLLGMLVAAIVLVAGLGTVEMYARFAGHYMPLATPLVKRLFVDKDRARLFNETFVRTARFRFGTFPEPPDTFASESLYPRFVFKPHVRLAPQGEHLLAVPAGGQAYWSTNNLGLRGPDVSPRKAPGVIRIVCLGASTTEGVFNADDETYPHYLQRLLDQANPGQFEVINAGISGAILDDLIGLFLTRLAALEPDIVLFYEAHNDIGFQEFVPGVACDVGLDCWLRSYPSWMSWIARRSAVAMALVAANVRARPTVAMAHRLADEPRPPSLRQYEANLRRLVDEVRQAGVHIVLSSYATVAHDGLQVDRREHPELYDDLVLRRFPITPGEFGRIYAAFNDASRSVAADCGVPYADVAATFPREPRHFPFDIIHLSASGNQLLAERLAEAVRHRDEWPDPVPGAVCQRTAS